MKPAEKVLNLITHALDSEYVTVTSVMKYVECNKRTALRLINLVHDIQHEVKFIRCSMVKGVSWNETKLRVRLNKNYKEY